jgi:membrane dipeptidase
MNFRTVLFAVVLVGLAGACGPEPPAETDLQDRAVELAREALIVDGHIDIPYRLGEYEEDISQATIGGDFDYPRARAGGLNAPFMSIYVSSSYQQTGGARAKADSLIDLVERFEARWPDQFAVARRAADLRSHMEAGLISLPMGMENGAPVERDLANLQHFYERGIRYITLTHALDNQICDSSYDSTRTWNGLSPFGRTVVPEMNRLGIMIDVSHVSDSTFYQVVELSSAPVIASHSSARHFTPGWERTMSDDMIRRLAENGGVIMVNFGSSFLRSEYQPQGGAREQEILDELARRGIERFSEAGHAYYNEQRRAQPIGTLADVVAHIDHIVGLVGTDHVGLGSDFDGVFALPDGLQDVSEYPNLVHALLQKGYTEADITKILGGNLERAWTEVERLAAPTS